MMSFPERQGTYNFPHGDRKLRGMVVISCRLRCPARLLAEQAVAQPSPPGPRALTIRSGGGVLRMKHLIWPFSPCRACWVWVLEMMGGPVGEIASHQGCRKGRCLA